MSTPLSDTDPEAERRQIDLLRRATLEQRLRLTLSLSDSVLALARAGIASGMPGASRQEIGLRFVELHYGRALADDLRRHVSAHP